jgi:hypothetical protein
MQTNAIPNHSGNGNGNNMMEMMKTQMMTMMMINSANGNSSSGGRSGIYDMMYIFIVTGIIDFICKQMGPSVMTYVKQYYSEKLKSSKMLKDLVKPTDKTLKKTASITILVNIADHQNIIGQSLLDYITNNQNTKHISYKKQNFILNEFDVIEISDEYFIKLAENKVADASDSSGGGGIEQTVELFSYSKTMKEVRSFLDKITHEYKIKIENKLGDKMYYFNQHPMNAPPIGSTKEKDYSKLPPNSVFTMKPFQTNRKFSNLFGPEIEVVRKRVEFFTKNRKWYDAKGIPYTLGLLLSGQAGAGKTSSIKCLANETKRHIININLNNDITKTQLENLFFNEMLVVINVSTGQSEKYYIPLDQRIYVLEDIDCQSDLVMERSLKNTSDDDESKKETQEIPVTIKTNPHKPETYENKNKNPIDFTQAEKIDLSFLLNLLDGVLEIPGRIVIMTSNYPKMLDHALIRPGRIDVIADFKRCSHQTMIQMIEFFYDISLTDSDKNIIMKTKEETFSPAEMGKLMFENFGNYQNVLETLASEYTVKEVEEKNDVVVVSTIPTEVFVENTCCELENGVTLIEDIPITNPIQTQLSRIGSYYNREYELLRDNMQTANTDEEKGHANFKLLVFKAKLKYDAEYAKTEKEKGYAVEMLTELDLLEIKMENRYKLEKTPSMQCGHLAKFEKICQKVIDAKTEKEIGCADVELIHFRTNLQVEASHGESEQAKSSAQELLKRVELLKTLSEQKLAEKGNFVGAWNPSNPKKTYEEISKESRDVWDTWGDHALGDKSGLDGVCGSSKYAELKELYG